MATISTDLTVLWLSYTPNLCGTHYTTVFSCRRITFALYGVHYKCFFLWHTVNDTPYMALVIHSGYVLLIPHQFCDNCIMRSQIKCSNCFHDCLVLPENV